MNTSIRLNEFFAINLWRWKCGLPEITSLDKMPAGSMRNIEDAYALPPEFREIVELADNRMAQGRFRYGPANVQKFLKYDYKKETQRRLDLYWTTHNLEHLVDALNMIRIRYCVGKYLGEQMISVDDGQHAKQKGEK